MPGPRRLDPGNLYQVAREFGWEFEASVDLRTVAAAQAYRKTVAVFFHREAFGSYGWLDAVQLLREALPGALPVACHGFSEPVDWPALSDAGLFHSLWLPLKESEVRRTFGFVWERRKRLVQAVRTPKSAMQHTLPDMLKPLALCRMQPAG